MTTKKKKTNPRSELRDGLFAGASEVQTQIFKLKNGKEVELRSTPLKERNEIAKRAGLTGKEPDVTRFQCLALIGTAYVPGTDDKLFEPGDLDFLERMSAGSELEALSLAATRMLNLDSEELEKN